MSRSFQVMRGGCSLSQAIYSEFDSVPDRGNCLANGSFAETLAAALRHPTPGYPLDIAKPMGVYGGISGLSNGIGVSGGGQDAVGAETAGASLTRSRRYRYMGQTRGA